MKKKLGIILVIIGVILLATPKISQKILLHNEKSVSIENIPQKTLKKNAEKSSHRNFDHSKVESIDPDGVILNREKADLSKVIGQIVIPSVNMNIALFDGMDNNSLMHGACTMKPEQFMGTGNYSVAGHYCRNRKILFGALVYVKPGDIIKITDKQDIYFYRVFKTEAVRDDRTDLIDNEMVERIGDGDPLISLMTCYYNREGYRFFVFGKYEYKLPYSESEILKGLKN